MSEDVGKNEYVNGKLVVAVSETRYYGVANMYEQSHWKVEALPQN